MGGSGVKLKDTKEYRLGVWGEERAESLLQEAGCYILPARLYTGDGAPKLQGETFGHLIGLIAPDLFVARRGEAFWVEVKTKTTCGHFRKYGTKTHAIDRRHWHHYLDVERESGNPVSIMVIERDTGDVLIARRDALHRHLILGEGRMENTYCFPRGEFDLLATLGDGELFSLRSPKWFQASLSRRESFR